MNKFKRDIEDDEIRIISLDHDVDLASEPTRQMKVRTCL